MTTEHGSAEHTGFRVPRPLRRTAASSVEWLAAGTGPFRLLPTFIIVGGQRCGTNSLYEYICRHPTVARVLFNREVHFFDLNFHRGLNWYRGHFPTRMRARVVRLRSSSSLITGESSPYYLFHPLAPERIAKTLPETKLLVLLRNPVDRAYSHYHHERAQGTETLPFEEAIEREPERLGREVERLIRDPAYRSHNHQRFSYLARGDYAAQLQNVFTWFPRERVLVLISEQLFADPADAHARVLRFLGLPHFPLADYAKHNPGRYDDLDPRLRARLVEHFREPNERLYRLLDLDFRWED